MDSSSSDMKWSFLKRYREMEEKCKNLSAKVIRKKIKRTCDRMRFLSEILARKECEEISKIPPPPVLKRSQPLDIAAESSADDD